MWGRIDDKLHAHPDWLALRDSSPAWLLWTCLSWALAYSPSGFIPASVAKGFGAQRTMAKLVATGWWVAVDGGYQIHNFARYSTRQGDAPQKPAPSNLSEKRRAAGAAGAAKRWQTDGKPEMANDGKSDGKSDSNLPSLARGPARASPDPDPDPDVYDVGLPSAPSADRIPWVPPPDPDAPKPVEEAVEIAGKHGIDRGTVATCLPRWRGQRSAFSTAMAFVAAHAPKGFGAGYVVAAFRGLDPDLVDGWDRAGRPAPSAPPKAHEKPPVRFDLGLDEPTTPPRKPRQPPPPPLRRVGDAADGSQAVQAPADASAGLRAAGGAT